MECFQPLAHQVLFFWLVFFDLCMYARIYLYLLILSLSSTTYTYLLLFRSLFFDEPHDSSSSFFSKPHSRQPHRVYTPFGAAAADASSHVYSACTLISLFLRTDPRAVWVSGLIRDLHRRFFPFSFSSFWISKRLSADGRKKEKI